ncbi:DUF5368 domain-containing protein [Rubrimonas cliftonensis]|uniref:Uncharacterized protein n=1 Tax=Rubrimonas cliftonensis TaxID=89524 RepID=A0A1H3YEJ7_9RHOB|nr:DUF5368 domain-containing protein [Rubrimonas cliftonensis]SEA10040.1 hypothetical protein SAMN05444370_10366 [Rubrimonas cliftonensis]
MKDLTLGMVIAVWEEMFGPALFWGMAGAAAVVTLLYLYVLIRDRRVSWRKFLLAQLAMPFGAAAAVGFVWRITHSGLRDVGGPVDVIVLMGVAAAGAVGAAVLVYTAQSLVRRPAAEE